jgi:hypothetical protein
MSPKWATEKQEEFLNRWYRQYLDLKFKGKRSLFKDFWASLKSDWIGEFGWEEENNVDKKGAPCLEKVSYTLSI